MSPRILACEAGTGRGARTAARVFRPGRPVFRHPKHEKGPKQPIEPSNNFPRGAQANNPVPRRVWGGWREGLEKNRVLTSFPAKGPKLLEILQYHISTTDKWRKGKPRTTTTALTDPERLQIFRQHIRPDGVFVLRDHKLGWV